MDSENLMDFWWFTDALGILLVLQLSSPSMTDGSIVTVVVGDRDRDGVQQQGKEGLRESMRRAQLCRDAVSITLC